MQDRLFENNLILNYIESEVFDLHHELCVTLGREYAELYNTEVEAYRHSPEYKKAKSKAYWSRPKEDRDYEALENELAKLDYWVPRRGTNDKHISYSKKVDDDSSSKLEPLVGFVPSMSKAKYYRKAGKKVEKKVSDPILLSVFESLIINDSIWIKSKKFDEQLHGILSSVDDQQYLERFRENVMYIYDILKINLSNKKRIHPRTTVTNGCRIDAIILEQQKFTSISIDVCKFRGQLPILGKSVGEKFKLANIPLTYQIEAIYR